MNGFAQRLLPVCLAILILAGLVQLPDRVQQFIVPVLPIVNLWSDPEAQHRLQLGAVPYDILRELDARLPRDAVLLLVTNGRDVRHVEYETLHRALYYLTPRPVWWASPAPSDGTWEACWWITTPLTTQAIRQLALDKHVTHVLLYDTTIDLALGPRVIEWPNAYLLQLNSDVRLLDRPLPSISATGWWPIQLALSLAVIMLLGNLVLSIVGRLGYRAQGIEALALAWVLGGGLASLGMLWLNALGLSLTAQVSALTLVAFIGWAGILKRWSHNRKRWTVHLQFDRLKLRPLTIVLAGCFALQLVFVIILVVGQPLTVWDSWSSWGMRARTIFVEGSITQAVYADPSRASTLPYYPLFTSLLQAWLYAWLSAPDDRLAGAVSLLFYLSLAGVCYSAVRRRGGSSSLALAAMVAVTSMPTVALLAGFAFVDLPLMVLVTSAVVYVIDWLEKGVRGALIIAALSAGLMPWAKREGWILVVALCLAVFMQRGSTPARRAWAGSLACLGAALILAGPWWMFVALNGYATSESMQISANSIPLARVPVIAQLVRDELASGNWNFIWLIVALLALVSLITARPFARAWLGRPSRLFLIVTPTFLSVMAASYAFSSFVPYEQHILSSFYRLVAQVAALPVLWLVYCALEQSAAFSNRVHVAVRTERSGL